MAALATQAKSVNRTLPKSPTGIEGLDEITGGGLPTGRPTLLCGSAGCGKTLMAMEFLVRGATQFKEPGVFMAFEENVDDLTKNVRSLGFDLDELIRRKKISIDFVRLERNEIAESGEYDLEGLFVRLGYAIDTIGAKRVVLDTIETLFGGLSNTGILRAELRRLFRWLKDKGVTAVITGERGESSLTRQGLEEYVSDCVILLDHRVNDQISTRRLRIVKYRGTTHGTNEYPFLIDERGIDVLPITTVGLNNKAASGRISSGIPQLDTMMTGKGYFRGSSILISGSPGIGKTSMAAHFALAACKRGERCLYFAFEESSEQIVRNMRSVGIDLQPHVTKGLLRFQVSRPTLSGLETHLAIMYKAVRDFEPTVVCVDPISNLITAGTESEARAMLVRLVDMLKARRITALFTNMTSAGSTSQEEDLGVPSLIDSWLLLRDIELGGERNRGMYILKSRGMAHSNQIREFLLTSKGIQLADVYLGPEGVLTGSMRQAQEAREKATAMLRQQETASRTRTLDRKRSALEAQIIALRAEFDAEEEVMKRAIDEDQASASVLVTDRAAMSRSRSGDRYANQLMARVGHRKGGNSR